MTGAIFKSTLLISVLIRIVFTAAWKERILLIASVFHLIRARDNLQLL